MILTLELWPRHSAVERARDVVAAHPEHHVIVDTHMYLRSDGSISTRHEYGATSPRYLFDKLVSACANIRMVFSGHVGNAANRVVELTRGDEPPAAGLTGGRAARRTP